MWFIIRCVFCVGLVFSKVPASGVSLDSSAFASALGAAEPVLNEGLSAMFNACEGHFAACLDTARRLQGDTTVATSGEPSSGSDVGIAGDTLTAADRAAPWHGTQKRPRSATGNHTSS